MPRRSSCPQLSFAEAAELAYFGAKVLHPKTIHPALARAIPVRILNSRRPDGPGTRITADPAGPRGPVAAFACKRQVTVIDVTSGRMLEAHGFLRRLFQVFERHQTSVDVVTTSEVSVSVTVDDVRHLDGDRGGPLGLRRRRHRGSVWRCSASSATTCTRIPGTFGRIVGALGRRAAQARLAGRVAAQRDDRDARDGAGRGGGAAARRVLRRCGGRPAIRRRSCRRRARRESDMDLRQLEILRAVAESGSFTGRRAAPARVAIGGQPADPAARSGAERAAVLAHQAQGADHADRRGAAAARDPRVPGHQGDDRQHHRDAGEAHRQRASRRRHDRVAVRLPGAAEGVQAAASRGGRAGDHRIRPNGCCASCARARPISG